MNLYSMCKKSGRGGIFNFFCVCVCGGGGGYTLFLERLIVIKILVALLPNTSLDSST